MRCRSTAFDVSASRVSDELLLAETTQDVNPNDDTWNVALSVSPTHSSATVYVYADLLHRDTDGMESVQYSGRSDAIELTPGAEVTPDVQLVRGPLANLFTTGIAITSAPATMVVGEAATLVADVTTSEAVPPTVFWTSLDPEVVRSSGATVTALSAGTAEVVASAGAFADTVSIGVFAPLAITTASLASAIQGVAYEVTLELAGGDGIYNWSVSAGELPGGLALETGTGVISGTPTTVESQSFTIEVSSGDGQTATCPYSIRVRDDAPAGFTIVEPVARRWSTNPDRRMSWRWRSPRSPSRTSCSRSRAPTSSRSPRVRRRSPSPSRIGTWLKP